MQSLESTRSRFAVVWLLVSLIVIPADIAAANGGAQADATVENLPADLLLITGSTQAAGTSATASDYCKSLGPAAGEARMKWQADQLSRLERQVEDATAELEQRRKELQGWIKRRDDFIRRANDQLIAIYRSIKPEVAALQLSELDDETASAILLKLDARVASRIFDELPGPRAARLVTLISGASAFPSQSDGQAK